MKKYLYIIIYCTSQITVTVEIPKEQLVFLHNKIK